MALYQPNCQPLAVFTCYEIVLANEQLFQGRRHCAEYDCALEVVAVSSAYCSPERCKIMFLVTWETDAESRCSKIR